MRLGRITTISAALVALSFGASACGSEADDFADQSATEIRDAALADMKKAKSLTMKGDYTAQERKTSLEISMNDDGECTGTISLGGVSAELLNTKDASYLKADEDFWKLSLGANPQADLVVKTLAGKWAKVPPTSGGFAEECDLDALVDKFTDSDDDAGKKGKVKDVDGEQAVPLVSKNGKETTTVWVAAEGRHYILKIDVEGGEEPGGFAFSDYDKKVELDVPADKDVVDFSSVQ